jgi:glutathione-regulated potassium-efflux system ancillary protein KefG
VAFGFMNVLKKRRPGAPARPRTDLGELVAPGAVTARPALVILSHPALHRSRVNSALLAAVSTRSDVTVHDLYKYYPDFLIDVEAEQRKLLSHRLIVLQYPMYWYATPALLKEWFDTVLLHGFAFGSGGTKLPGKTLLLAVTTGGDRDTYQAEGLNRFTISELLRPLEATANLCGLSWAEPFIVHDAVRMDAEGRAAAAGAYGARISALIAASGS